jgi:hypothetical protein
VQRIASILLRRTWREEHLETLGGLLQGMMNREAVRLLRRALRPRTDEEMKVIHRRREAEWRDWWLREHPGRTRAEYDRGLGDDASEVWEWRRTKGQAANRAEAEAWEEHLCGLTDREYTDYARWQRQRQRRLRRSSTASSTASSGSA